MDVSIYLGFPGGSGIKNLPANAGYARDEGLIPGSKKKWRPSPVFLSGKAHRQRRLASSSAWGHRVGNDWAHTHTKYSKASTDSVISQNQVRLYAEKCFANSKVWINIKGFLKRKFRGSHCQISALGLEVQSISCPLTSMGCSHASRIPLERNHIWAHPPWQ